MKAFLFSMSMPCHFMADMTLNQACSPRTQQRNNDVVGAQSRVRVGSVAF